MVHSFAYGLHLVSNIPIPGHPASRPEGPVDVEIRLGDALDDLIASGRYEPRYTSPFLDENGEPVVIVSVRTDTGSYLWVYSDGPRFILDPEGRTIAGDWPGTATREDAALYLLGPILGFVLRLRGITCLHASAVAIGGKAIAFVGPASAGKSTTAAALVRRGYPLVSEDVAPVVDRGAGHEIIPGYPLIRLWPRAVRMLYGHDASLPLLTQSWDKRGLDVTGEGYAFQPNPLPLGGIYYLTRRSWNNKAPVVVPMPAERALMALVGDAYTSYALTKEMRAREFELLGRLMKAVPFRCVIPHKDPARLEQLCSVIVEDFERHAGVLAQQNAGQADSCAAPIA